MPGPEPERADAGPERGPSADATATTPLGLVCLRDENDDGTTCFALSGELDLATAPELHRGLSDAARRAAAAGSVTGRCARAPADPRTG